MATISACALAALVWSYFGRLDVHATAPGKIETAGYAKVIEPLDPGKIAAIHVEKGQTVKAGDLLLELDPAEADADALSAQNALNASLAEIARRRYAIDAVRAAEIDAQSARDRLDARSKDDAPRGRLRLGRKPGRRGRTEGRLGRGCARTVPAARRSRAASGSCSALRRAQGARQADGGKAGDAKAPQHEHRLPEHADGDLEPARLDPAAGDRPQGRHQDRSL